ncbi:MAG: protein kinase [Anaerolinea sp.]|nr:protein kinase [Anaerolinea sp.]
MSPTLGVTGRYVLHDKLGEGGMGEVYAAFDRLTSTKVALKRVLVTPQKLVFNTRIDTVGADVDLRRVWANEFRVLSSLRHPHIISVLDYGFDNEQFPYYTMTLIPQPRTIIEAGKNFSLSGRIEAFAQMLQALAYLHRRGILHRDFKPANVLVDERDAVKVLDFGLAAQEGVRGSTGTLAYMPPEIIQEGEATQQSDLYSLGLVAFELFAGTYPFEEENGKALIDQLLLHIPDLLLIPENLRPIIGRLLMKDPADRYPDADSALSDLAALTGGAILVEDAVLRDSYLQAARFIGREAELALLAQRLERIVQSGQGMGAAYLLAGEAGVGKSRLLDELRTHALLKGALVLRSQCVAESAQPFQLWRDVLRRLLLESDINDLEAGILREIIPDIAELLGRSIPPVAPLGAVSAQDRLVETIVSLFERQTSAIALILEDLQWGGENLIPLARLSRAAGKLPLLIVGSFRNDEAPLLPAQVPDMIVITLGRLTPDEIADLSRAMIGASGEQQRLVDYLHRQSEGNVLFLVEVIRALAQEAGNLRGIGTMALPDHVFAGSIERIITRRMSRLPVEAAPALQLAAVAGRTIDEALLRWLVGADADRWLQAGMNAAILEVVDAQLRFAHDRLRDAVISMIPEAELPQYHQSIAEGLEHLYPDATHLAVVLYEHWRAAGNSEKEAYYAVMVLEQRIMLGILPEATQMMEKALVLQPQDPRLQLKLLVLAGEVYYDIGKPDNSSEMFTEALSLAKRLSEPVMEGRALEGLGNAATALSSFDAAERWYDQSIALQQAYGDIRGLASSLHYLSILQRMRGKYDLSWTALQDSIRLRRESGDLRGVGDSLYQLAVHARQRGEYAAAIQYLTEGTQLRREIGDGRGLADDLNNLGICYVLTGALEQAQATLMESLNLRQVRNNERGVASSQNALGELALVRSKFGAALRCFTLGLAIWSSKSDQWNIANSYASVGYTQARIREILSAKVNLYEGLYIARRISAGFIILKALIGWAQVALLEGDNLHAALLLGVIDQHPALTAQLRQVYYAPVFAQFDAETYAVEYALGKESDVQGVVNLTLKQAQDGF